MLDFIGGLVAGGIVGVAADRLWQWYERRPRVAIQHSYFTDVRGQRGLMYTLQNVGGEDIPEYGIALFHADRGTWRFLPTKDTGPLRPRQKREHSYPVFGGDPSTEHIVREWFYTCRDRRLDDVPFVGFKFRLVMTNSDRVLFESEKMGNALARYLVRAYRTGKCGGPFEDDREMDYPERGLRGMVRRWRSRRELNRIIADAQARLAAGQNRTPSGEATNSEPPVSA